MYLITLFIYLTLGCTLSNNSAAVSAIQGRIDNELIDLHAVTKNAKLNINFERGYAALNQSSKAYVSSISPLILKEISSISGNETKIVSSNSFDFLDTQGKRTDILKVKAEIDGKDIEERIEVRLSEKSETCLGIYLAGDNDLNGGRYNYSGSSDFVKKDLNELTKVTFNDEKIQIILMLDRESVSDSEYSGTIFEDPGIFLIKNGEVVRIRRVEEPNMGKSETLTFFLNCMKDYCESDRKILDIWSHGFSIFGVGFDQSHENDSLTPYEIRKGIEESNLSRVDVLIFSACLMMDLGVLGELKDYVEAVTGSADSVPGDGSFYGNSGNRGIVGVIEDYSSSTSVDMAKAICVANYESYFNKNQQNAYGDIYQFLTYSAVDQSKADKVMSSLKELILDNSGELRSSFFQLFSEFILNESVFYSCYDYSGTSNVGDVLDLGSFAYALSKSGNAKADALLQSIKEYIVEAKHIRAEPEFNEEHIGLGILFKYPESNFGSYYINTNETYRNTGWNLLINPDN